MRVRTTEYTNLSLLERKRGSRKQQKKEKKKETERGVSKRQEKKKLYTGTHLEAKRILDGREFQIGLNTKYKREWIEN